MRLRSKGVQPHNDDGLSSGTKYALRVRALGKGLPTPWSSLVQQMAP